MNNIINQYLTDYENICSYKFHKQKTFNIKIYLPEI